MVMMLEDTCSVQDLTLYMLTHLYETNPWYLFISLTITANLLKVSIAEMLIL